MGLIFEKLYPVIGGLLSVTATGLALRAGWSPPRTAAQLFTSGLQIGAIAIGFIATAQTLLLSIGDQRIIAKLKDKGYYALLVGYTFSALMWWALLILLSAAGMLLPDVTAQTLPRDIIIVAWLGACVTAILCWVRIFRIYSEVLKPSPLSSRDTGDIELDLRPRCD